MLIFGLKTDSSVYELLTLEINTLTQGVPMRKYAVTILITIFMMIAFSTVASAQDGRATTSASTRIVPYCRSTYVELWGTDNNSVGQFLTSVSYSEILQPGIVTRFTNYGQVRVNGTIDGMMDAYWLGGPFNGTGTGDFFAWFNCTIPASLVESMLTTTALTSTTTMTTPTTVTTPVTTTTTTTPVTTVVVANTSCGYANTHTVRQGENLFRIGLRYGVGFITLAACNGISDPTRIYVGQVLRVP